MREARIMTGAPLRPMDPKGSPARGLVSRGRWEVSESRAAAARRPIASGPGSAQDVPGARIVPESGSLRSPTPSGRVSSGNNPAGGEKFPRHASAPGHPPPAAPGPGLARRGRDGHAVSRPESSRPVTPPLDRRDGAERGRRRGPGLLDSARESSAALRDFAEEQVTLAKALGVSMTHRPTGDAARDVSVIAEGLTARRGRAVVVLIGPTGGGEWRVAGGATVLSPELAAASARGDAVLRIARDDATPVRPAPAHGAGGSGPDRRGRPDHRRHRQRRARAGIASAGRCDG